MRSGAAVLMSVLAIALFFSPLAEAGQAKNRKRDKRSENTSGTIEYILDHSVELKLTLDQTKELDTLMTVEEAIMADPVITAMYSKIREARRNANQQAIEEQKKRISEKIREKTGGKYGSLQENLNKILTAEQQKTLAALKEKNEPAAKDSSKTDPKMDGRLNPFEF